MTTSSSPTQRGLDAAPIDLADAVLLQSCRMHGTTIVCTDDAKLSQMCVRLGLIAETPIPSALRQQIAAWESANLPSKGLARLLYHVRTWLDRQDQGVAQEFWNQTGAGSHLP